MALFGLICACALVFTSGCGPTEITTNSSHATRPLEQGAPPVSGLLGEYFSDSNFEALYSSRIEPTIDFPWRRIAPLKAAYSARWTGNFTATHTGPLKFILRVLDTDGVRLWVGGQLIINDPIPRLLPMPPTPGTYETYPLITNPSCTCGILPPCSNCDPLWLSGEATLTQGESYAIKIEYTKHAPSDSVLQLRQAWNGGASEVVPSSQLSPPPPPPDDPFEPTGQTPFEESVKFIYSGGNPWQTGLDETVLEPHRTALLRGKVMDRAGLPLEGVTTTVLGHTQYGHSTTREDGTFNLVVNGGGTLVVNYAKAGFLPAQRRINTPWRDYAVAPDVVLIPLDPQATAVSMSHPTAQVAQGSPVTDSDGTRQGTLIVPPGTTATMTVNGVVSPLYAATIRVSEYTVGENGVAAMPGELPPAIGYTYAVELSADEAILAGATQVDFSPALAFYVENFLGFPVGGIVPTGYYDREVGLWKASGNGVVVEVVGITGGLAELDIDGDGLADSGPALSTLGVTADELEKVGSLYTAGTSLWRVPIPHFSPWDHNWPFGPPPGAQPPNFPPPKPQTPESEPDCQSGSIIECQNQTLRESIPLVGVPARLHYNSDRAPGRLSNNHITIPLKGNPPPPGVKVIIVEWTINGRKMRIPVEVSEDSLIFQAYDGQDPFERLANRKTKAFGRIGYVFDGVYQEPNGEPAFGNFSGNPITGSRTREEVTLWQDWEVEVGGPITRKDELGGWSLGIHHTLDIGTGIVDLGSGGTLSSPLSGNSARGENTELIGNESALPLTSGCRSIELTRVESSDIEPAPDGSLFLSNPYIPMVFRLYRNGVICHVAGTGADGNTGDGGPATAARLAHPTDVALAPDGSFFILTRSGAPQRIRKVATDGTITTVAGGGTHQHPPDGASALTLSIEGAKRITSDPQGNLYIPTWGRIYRLNTDGTLTHVAGGGSVRPHTVGSVPAKAANISPSIVHAMPNGDLLASETGRLYRLRADGHIYHIAGSSDSPDGGSGDGGPALAASLGDVLSISSSANGNIYVPGTYWGIRVLTPDGLISTHGDPKHPNGDSVQALAVGVTPSGVVYLTDGPSSRVLKLSGYWSTEPFEEYSVPSEDGSLIFVFDSSGRHQVTLESLTDSVLYRFSYDTSGRLVSIEDSHGLTTHIERNGLGLPEAIVGPYGHRTTLALDLNGHLASVTNPAAETVSLHHDEGGLLIGMQDARGGTHTYSYDEASGRLLSDTNAAGHQKTLLREDGNNGDFEVSLTTGLGRSNRYAVTPLSGGGQIRTMTRPDGSLHTRTLWPDGSRTEQHSDGTTVQYSYEPDPRFGSLAPFINSARTTLPSYKFSQVTRTREATFASGGSGVLESLKHRTVVDGAAWVTTYTTSTRKWESLTPEGRSTSTILDPTGRVIETSIPGIIPFEFFYDAHGRLASVQQGGRTTAYTYFESGTSNGRLQKVTDALGRETTFAYDSAGRVVSQVLPGARTIAFSSDAHGNMTSVTPPGRPSHSLVYTPADALASYEAPSLPGVSVLTSHTYDGDGALVSVTQPGGTSILITRDSSGRAAETSASGRNVARSYNASGRLEGLTSTAGSSLTYTYDGPLLTTVSWSGPVSGSVAYGYSPQGMKLESVTAAGTTVNYTYDRDGLITSAGTLQLDRNTGGIDNGSLRAMSLGSTSTSVKYDAHGDLESLTSSTSSSFSHSVSLIRDTLGRITKKTDVASSNGTTSTLERTYEYDVEGRLHNVNHNGTPVATYLYDKNNNRISTNGTTINATYDAQDRIQEFNGTNYVYTQNGELASRGPRAGESGSSAFIYDNQGHLTQVTLPNGSVVDYILDAAGRRVGKKYDGTMVQGFLYDGSRIIAELDGAGATVSRFVYASQSDVPDYMIRNGTSYRIITDHLGSVRYVVDAASGSVAQRIEYIDDWGQVDKVNSSGTGFQPFGFAGGHYDPDTSLVRFGARDYDAETGRWTTKDPIRFAGGDSNLYAYVNQNPVQMKDPSGLIIDAQFPQAAAALDRLYRIPGLGPLLEMMHLDQKHYFIIAPSSDFPDDYFKEGGSGTTTIDILSDFDRIIACGIDIEKSRRAVRRLGDDLTLDWLIAHELGHAFETAYGDFPSWIQPNLFGDRVSRPQLAIEFENMARTGAPPLSPSPWAVRPHPR